MTAPDPSIEVMRLVTGAWAARLVHTAVELGIADHLAGTLRGVDFLAAEIGAHAPFFLTGVRPSVVTRLWQCRRAPTRMY